MTKKLSLPNVIGQASIPEVLKDIEKGDIVQEDIWIEVDGEEVRFCASNDTKLQSEKAGYSAIFTSAALQLDIYRNGTQISLLRLGNLLSKLPKTWGRVTCGDILSSQAIFGDENGGLRVLDLGDPEADIKDLNGHLLHTSIARFFPSGKVALSAGMDYKMKLWDIDSGSMVQTLCHQKGMIDDVAMIDRGRNLLSLCRQSNDVVLWEVGKPQVMHTYSTPGARCIKLWNSNCSNGVSGGSNEFAGPLGIVGADKHILTLDTRTPDTNILIEQPAETLDTFDNTLVWAEGQNAFAIDFRMPREHLFELTSPHDITSISATHSKVYLNTGPTVYGFEHKTRSVEVLCCEARGIAIVNQEELWHIGENALRHFPL